MLTTSELEPVLDEDVVIRTHAALYRGELTQIEPNQIELRFPVWLAEPDNFVADDDLEASLEDVTFTHGFAYPGPLTIDRMALLQVCPATDLDIPDFS